jgi:hypothetical protein
MRLPDAGNLRHSETIFGALVRHVPERNRLRYSMTKLQELMTESDSNRCFSVLI